MTSVKVRDKNLEKYIKIFNYEVYKSGVLQEFRKRQEFQKPSKIKREKRKKAKFNQKIKKSY